MNILFTYANKLGLGRLYNRPALEDSREIAPTGWRAATLTDYTDLLTYLGGAEIAGGKMKSLTKWTAPNTGASNSTGLNALPAGQRSETGVFSGILLKTIFWIK